MKASLSRWTTLVLLVVASGQAFAQSSMDDRVQKLEETVRVLESRVASLEAQLPDRNAQTQVAPANANWRKLKKGMSESDVERLLGSPTRVEANTLRTHWYYGTGPYLAYVEFDSNRRKVEGWSEPRQ